MSEFEHILSGLVRVGTVTDRKMEQRLARVWFPDLGISSDWLPVLINQDVTPDDIPREYDAPQWTEFETEDKIPQALDAQGGRRGADGLSSGSGC